MAKTPGQRGEFGRWLERVRKSRYDTQAKALADMDRLAGLRIAPSEYAQWESGSRVPRFDNPKVARLYEFFGSSPEPDTETPPGGDQTALVAAIENQTRAISELVELLRPMAEAQAQQVADLQAAVQRLLSERGMPTAQGLPVPRDVEG